MPGVTTTHLGIPWARARHTMVRQCATRVLIKPAAQVIHDDTLARYVTIPQLFFSLPSFLITQDTTPGHFALYALGKFCNRDFLVWAGAPVGPPSGDWGT